MKKITRFALVLALLSLAVGPLYAPCFYPRARTVYYYQYHQSCGEPQPPHNLRICIDYWSLDGECYTDCDGNTTCSGDTRQLPNTMYDYDFEPCEPICE